VCVWHVIVKLFKLLTKRIATEHNRKSSDLLLVHLTIVAFCSVNFMIGNHNTNHSVGFWDSEEHS